jgi:REP element-mobilizing transposase RayT
MEGYRKSAHATYRCEYHFVWVPKYRYRVLLKDVKKKLNVYKKGTQVPFSEAPVTMPLQQL